MQPYSGFTVTKNLLHRYLTATPGLAAPRAARKVLGSVDNKLKGRRDSIRGTPGVSKTVLNFDDDQEEGNADVSESCQGLSEVSGPNHASSVQNNPELLTGDLASACAIM